jgi:putative FmdB family regulatory protein
MPLYNYECRRHGEFSEWASLKDYDKPVPCPSCGKLAERTVSAAYLGMDTQLNKAFGSSEKSAHEPRVVRRRRGGPIPVHDTHSDLSKIRGQQHTHAHDHAGHSHAGHSHGKQGHMKTVRSKHPWLVRH